MKISFTENLNWSVYKITNPVGQIYIGRTSNLEQRKRNHLNACYYHSGYRNHFFKQSVKFFGIDSHSFEVIDSFSGNINDADCREMFWIRGYMSNRNKWPDQNGLNLTDGGVGLKGYVHREESKMKMAKAKEGGRQSAEHKEKVRQAIIKAVVQYDLKGNKIKEFSSIREASLAIGTGEGGGRIAQICKGQQGHYSTKKFTFKYKEDAIN